MSANVGKTVWMKSPSEYRLQREKAASMGADVTSETREPILTNPLASSWGPPQAPDLIAIFVSMLYLFDHTCFYVTQEWMRLALLLLSLPSFAPLLSWVLGFGLCLTQNPMGMHCLVSLFLIQHAETFSDNTLQNLTSSMTIYLISVYDLSLKTM